MRTVTVREDDAAQRIERFAYRETKQQARRTCGAVPREVLARSFDAVSKDQRADTRREFTDNDIALLYVETIDISPVPLQRAAYDGCLAGLKRRSP